MCVCVCMCMYIYVYILCSQICYFIALMDISLYSMSYVNICLYGAIKLYCIVLYCINIHNCRNATEQPVFKKKLKSSNPT